MRQVVLGRTGLSVSVFGLGAGGDSRLGRTHGGDDVAASLVRTAIDGGVSFIDTAEAYGTEEAIGRALAEVPRDRVVLSTKKRTFDAAEVQSEVQPADVVAALEASLRRLRTDHVDIYHLHGVRPERYADLRDRLVPTLLDLKKQGKIRFLGITEAWNDDPTHLTLQKALADDLFDVVMVGFNLLNQSARETVFPRTLAQNVGTLIMFAVRRALSRPDRLRELLADLVKRGKIDPRTAEQGLDFLVHEGGGRSLPDAAYRFVRDEPGAHVVLSGTGDRAHLLENLASLNAPPLPEADRARAIALFREVNDVTGQ